MPGYARWFVVLALALVFSPLAAQDAACPALVERALSELGPNCADLGRNNACYGFNRVDATFSAPVGDDFFTQPADRTELTQLDTLQTAPYDSAFEQWGIAVMSVQANVPNSLPGQAVVFLLIGDAAVENAVPSDQALVTGDALTLTTVENARVRSGPGLNSNVLGVLDNGFSAQADGISPDGEWFRVLYGGGPAWVNQTVVSAPPEAASLPTITEDSRSPMQAFYLQTRATGISCDDMTDSLLVIQGPTSMKVNLTANAADVVIGSTIALNMPDENTLELLVIDGLAELDNVLVTPGFKVVAPLGETDAEGKPVVSAGGLPGVAAPWSDCQPLSDEELKALQPLENIPLNLLNYPIDVPDSVTGKCYKPGDIIPSSVGAGGGSGGDGGRGGGDTGNPDLISTPVPGCGNFVCEVGEDANNCSSDCRADAGGGSGGGTPANPTCGNAACEAGEDCRSCPGDCGNCPGGAVCGNRSCEAGEDCRSCPGDCGACPAPPICGNRSCEAGEDCRSCPGDCGACR